MISPFYVINPAQVEKPYFFPYLFQVLNDVIMSCKFTGIIFLERGRPRSKGSKQTEAGGAKKAAGVERGRARFVDRKASRHGTIGEEGEELEAERMAASVCFGAAGFNSVLDGGASARELG